MRQILGVGNKDFKKIIDTNTFYVDKTYFIEEWFSNTDEVTLITRPRRFGKTLTMSMLEYFLSDRYSEQAYLFENLYIFNESKDREKFREMQGSSPVINLSFAGIKCDTMEETIADLKSLMADLYTKYSFLLDSDLLENNEKKFCEKIMNEEISITNLKKCLNRLSHFLMKYTGKKVYIFLDEYDTPLHAAYTSGYWDKIAKFISVLFEKTFKQNEALDRAILTGITRVAKESIFSGLNNLEVVTTTSEKYAKCFGFTEEETFKALDMYGLSDKKEDVKKYYDGFKIGDKEEIYNPWSVINYLDKKKLGIYWANTSSNALIGNSIKQANSKIKKQMYDLLQDENIKAEVNEEIVFKELDDEPEAIWSLMLAAGYLKVINVKNDIYTLAITNYETKKGLESLVKGWFKKEQVTYNEFIDAMLSGNHKRMERMLNALSVAMFSSFDTGTKPSRKEPERFYHGFVLGLLVDMKDKYVVDSNRESGFGRYDIMIKPRDVSMAGVIIEFKVYDADEDEEETLQDTVENALKQIEEKNYEQKLRDEGIETIYKYGIAFCGKECKIGVPTKE